MNPYNARVVCDVCGGDGVAKLQDAAAEWTGAKLVHRDPRICQDFLRAKAEKLKQKEKELSA